ncbi:MAG: MSMEG_0565 family glycosyltransferase [Actinomycetota bacterium]|nr:MSMEG_0565 family glycosyltransferase [Actinomycetota bacterium]
MTGPRVALLTYSVKPRGGVVHTLALAEALHGIGADVTVVALGDPERGFYRPVEAPWMLVGPPSDAPTLEGRVFQSVDSLAAGLVGMAGRFDIVHAEDCISGRAAVRVRDTGPAAGPPVVRTVHHVDDFTTPALIDCQRRAILEPDRVLVVSRFWREALSLDYGVEADVVHNGADGRRNAAVSPQRRRALRRRVGAEDGRALFLAVGGIEPRKGSVHLLAALAELRRAVEPSPVLVVVGGHSFQDYAAYREAALAALPAMGLELGRDVLLRGLVDEDELTGWYAAADALVFPSLKEGWGLAVLEAMRAGLPVIATDIPVFREYLTDGRDALLVPPADPHRLAQAMHFVMGDPSVRRRLIAGGKAVAARFTWEATARRHVEIYESLLATTPATTPATT